MVSLCLVPVGVHPGRVLRKKKTGLLEILSPFISSSPSCELCGVGGEIWPKIPRSVCLSTGLRAD